MCHKIIGKSILTNDELLSFLLHKNPSLDQNFYKIGNIYLELSRKYHIRGDLAFFQMIISTNWLKDQNYTKKNNFYNLKSNDDIVEFNSIQEGVLSHIQHIFAYINEIVSTSDNNIIIDLNYNKVQYHDFIDWKQFDSINDDAMLFSDKLGNTVDHLYDECIEYSYKVLTIEQYKELLHTIAINNQKLETLVKSVEKLTEINETLKHQYDIEIKRNSELMLIIEENKQFTQSINEKLKLLSLSKLDNLNVEDINEDLISNIIKEINNRVDELSKEFIIIKNENKELKNTMNSLLSNIEETLNKVNTLLDKNII